MSLSPYLPDVIVICGAKWALFGAHLQPRRITMQSFGQFCSKGDLHLRMVPPARSTDREMP